MATAVTSFWAPLLASMPWLDAHLVTEEAFSIARKRCPRRFFLAVFRSVVARFHEAFGSRFRWKGFRLLGIDGTTVNLPACPALQNAFPSPSNGKGSAPHPQGLLVGLVELWTGVCVDFVFVQLKAGECRCVRFLARLLKSDDLLMADRNNPHYQLLAIIREKGAHFLMRLASNRYSFFERNSTCSGRREDYQVQIPIPQELRKWLPSLLTSLTVRILEYQLPNYQSSRLITSLLDPVLFPYDEIVSMYHERWRQETRHDEWKHTLQINNLRSLTRNGILKELFVQLTMNNVIRWIMTEAAIQEDLRPVDLQFKASKEILNARIIEMGAAPVKELMPIYKRTLEQIAKLRILVRPGRSYPRKNDSCGRDKGHGKIAKCAKLQPLEMTAIGV